MVKEKVRSNGCPKNVLNKNMIKRRFILRIEDISVIPNKKWEN